VFDYKAVMQYKLFSSHRLYLPEKPPLAKLKSIEEAEKLLEKEIIEEIPIKQMTLVGGLEDFCNFLGIDMKQIKTHSDLLKSSMKNTLDCLEVVESHLKQADAKARIQVIKRMEMEALGETVNELLANEHVLKFYNQVTNEVQSSTSDDKRHGYIVWLQYSTTRSGRKASSSCDSSVNPKIFSLVDSISPEPLGPTKAFIDSILSSTNKRSANKATNLDDNDDNNDGDDDDNNDDDVVALNHNMGVATSSVGTATTFRDVAPTTHDALSSTNSNTTTAASATAITNNNASTTITKTNSSSNKKLLSGANTSKLLEGAKLVTSVAKQLLEGIANGYPVASMDSLFKYDEACLSTTEVNFYSERSTIAGVLNLVKSQYDSAPKWVPLSRITVYDEKIEEQRLKDRERELLAAERIARVFEHHSKRKKQNAKEGEQIINFGGSGTNINSKGSSKSQQAQQLPPQQQRSVSSSSSSQQQQLPSQQQRSVSSSSSLQQQQLPSQQQRSSQQQQMSIEGDANK
jgi:hypothetical protein